VKALLLLVVVLAGVWLWRSRQTRIDPKTPKAATATPLDMVCCTQCGMHIPGNEAVQGRQGLYCCQDHLHRSEP